MLRTYSDRKAILGFLPEYTPWRTYFLEALHWLFSNPVTKCVFTELYLTESTTRQ